MTPKRLRSIAVKRPASPSAGVAKSEKKGRTEAFITRFARYYTPLVEGLAAIIAFVSPVLFGQSWTVSIKGAETADDEEDERALDAVGP